ncbi:MAG: hypothetical protein HZA10_08860 [Nitrospirae bacterium]|nr:hypothetical protein [Nitrospirota bacterium]
MKSQEKLGNLKNIYCKLIASFREKRLKEQKALIQIKMMSGCIKRIK